MEEILGSIYCNNSELFGTRLMKNMFRTIKAEKNDLGVVMKEKKIGNLYGFSGGNYAGNVYEKTICVQQSIRAKEVESNQ